MSELEMCFRGLLTSDVNETKINLIGLPYDKNASIGKGASEEPKVMRELSKHFPPLTRDGYIVSDYKMFDHGDIECGDKESCEDYFSRVQKKLNEIYELNKFTFVIGGDHSVAIPSERAFYDYAKRMNKEPVIIHIDAHPDICDIYEGSKYSHACPNRRAIDYGYKKENITLIGIRGFEEQEVIYFEENPEIKVYTASKIQNDGIEGLIDDLVKRYSDDKYIVYLSYDIDANDPSFAPGTGTPEAFGLNSVDTLKIITSIINKLNVQVMDIVEISPLIDSNDITTWLGLKTMYEVINEVKRK